MDAKRQNAKKLMERAVESGLITDLDVKYLNEDDCRIETIGIMATPEEVGQYVFRLTRETPAQLDTRIREENAKYYQLRTLNEEQRANTTGGRSRRRRRRKTRKYF